MSLDLLGQTLREQGDLLDRQSRNRYVDSPRRERVRGRVRPDDDLIEQPDRLEDRRFDETIRRLTDDGFDLV